MVQPMSRYSVGRNAYPELGPTHSVLDNQEQEGIALCWKREQAQLIVDKLNEARPPVTTAEHCKQCGRRRPDYIADPTCPLSSSTSEFVYCEWVTRSAG